MSVADWAARYSEKFGFALVPLRGKVPLHDAWNHDENLLTSAADAREYWTSRPHANIGACLEPSGLVSLDADNVEGTRLVLAAEGIDLDALIAATPTIIGRSPRLEFKAPAGLKLARKALVWPCRGAGDKPVTVLELRAGRVQDVLPPSIHPDTLKPYRWLTLPHKAFPPLPAALLELWQNFDAFKYRARNVCPWAPPLPLPAPEVPRPRGYAGVSVIARFNEAHDAVPILEAHGYIRVGKKRWKSPHGKNMGGVVLLPDGKVFCHHVSDPLGDNKPHDAFDLYARFEHGGDVRKAVKAAAVMMGMTSTVRS